MHWLPGCKSGVKWANSFGGILVEFLWEFGRNLVEIWWEFAGTLMGI